MTRDLNIKQLHHAEFAAFLADSREPIATFAKANRSETMYATHLTRLDSLLGDFKLAIDKAKKGTTSYNLSDVDKERDDATVTLFTLHKGFELIRIKNLKEAHDTLAPLFDSYKDLPKLNHDKQTVATKAFLASLAKEPYSSAITTLNLLPMVVALTNAQTKFDQAHQAKLAAKALKEVGKTQALRKELTQLYDLFFQYTHYSAQAYPEKVYFAKLEKELKAICEEYKHHLYPKRKAKETDPTPQEDEES